MRSRADLRVVGILAVGVIIGSLVGAAWVAQSHCEAEAYNRVTGHSVSAWDAMWIELNVDGDPE